MGRLFITPREINFISDLTKEVMKDVIGQRVFYYSISALRSQVHDVYNEAPEKIFDNPIDLDALVEWQPTKTMTNEFGLEKKADIKLWVHARDLIDKGINLSEGDFFSFGERFYEVLSFNPSEVVYGEVEHKTGYEVMGKQARQTQFVARIFGPTDEKFSDVDAVQRTYIQQRGVATNRNGATGDVRELQKNGTLDTPLTGPKEVSPKGDDGRSGSSFYDDEA